MEAAYLWTEVDIRLSLKVRARLVMH